MEKRSFVDVRKLGSVFGNLVRCSETGHLRRFAGKGII